MVAINLTGLGEDDRFIGVEIVIPAKDSLNSYRRARRRMGRDEAGDGLLDEFANMPRHKAVELESCAHASRIFEASFPSGGRGSRRGRGCGDSVFLRKNRWK